MKYELCTKRALALLALFLTAVPICAKPNVNKLGYQCGSLSNQDACRELAKIAMEDKHEYVRNAAVQALTDQALLAKVAVEAGDDKVRKWAVVKLTDQTVLAKLAVEATGSVAVRLRAVRTLTDQALLAKVAVEAEDEKVRDAAVVKLTDQTVLAKVALEDKDSNVREAAARKATDLATRAISLGRFFRSAAAFIGSATSISSKHETGMHGDQFREQFAELTDDLGKIDRAPDAEDLIQFATKIVEQYGAVAANMGSGQSWISIREGRVEVGSLAPVGGSLVLDARGMAVAQSNLYAAHDNTKRMLPMFYQMLSGQPADIQREVNDEIRAKSQ